MSSLFDISNTAQLGATSAYILSQPMSARQLQIASTTTVVTISSKTTSAEMPAVRMHENLSAEDREAREKGLALAAHIEYLYRTDQEFRRWYHEGIDEIEAGHFVTFSEDGWKEE